MTTYLFHDDKMVGWSIAASGALLLPVAALLLAWAMRPMREAVVRLDAAKERDEALHTGR